MHICNFNNTTECRTYFQTEYWMKLKKKQKLNIKGKVAALI